MASYYLSSTSLPLSSTLILTSCNHLLYLEQTECFELSTIFTWGWEVSKLFIFVTRLIRISLKCWINNKNPNLNLMTVQAMSARSRGGGSVGNWRLGEKCIWGGGLGGDRHDPPKWYPPPFCCRKIQLHFIWLWAVEDAVVCTTSDQNEILCLCLATTFPTLSIIYFRLCTETEGECDEMQGSS